MKPEGVKFHLLKKLASFTRKVRFRGMNRILRFIHDPDAVEQRHFEVILDYHDKLLMHLDTSSFLEWSLFFHGEYEPEILNIVRHLFRPGFVAVDAGAHVGSQTLLMSLYAGETGRVWAFEPHPSLFERLLLNLDLNRAQNVIPVNSALSDSSGLCELFSSAARIHGQAPSFYRANAHQEASGILVKTRTLDEIVEESRIERLDFIKIDTEGHELKIIKGGRRALRERRPHIVFEYDRRTWTNAGCEFGEMAELLGSLDYRLYEMRRDYFIPIKKECAEAVNILAVPGSRSFA